VTGHLFWMGLGIVAGWLLVILGLSYYARGRIGPARRCLEAWHGRFSRFEPSSELSCSTPTRARSCP
jgi:hypothetical protein